jgi:phospholipase C
VQRDAGFLAEGTGNDTFAVGYYRDVDLPFYGDLVRRFTIADHSFSSLLASTFPNRQYLHAATSEGRREDPWPLDVGIYRAETIWDRLRAAGVPARYYYVDLPVLALWGERNFDHIHPLDDYFSDVQDRHFPRVVMIDPGFGGTARTDDHPLGSVHLGQRFVQSVFQAFAASRYWERGLFVLTYDEWGGFFDHIRPRRFADDRASAVDLDDFGQGGFRVPTVIASPYARPGFVDSSVYDHTSIMRFLEWRFLGAPAEGPRGSGGRWWLTKRDRHANNIGATLVTRAEPELAFDVDEVLPMAVSECATPLEAPGPDPGTVPHGRNLRELVTTRFAPSTGRPWLGT